MYNSGVQAIDIRATITYPKTAPSPREGHNLAGVRPDLKRYAHPVHIDAGAVRTGAHCCLPPQAGQP